MSGLASMDSKRIDIERRWGCSEGTPVEMMDMSEALKLKEQGRKDFFFLDSEIQRLIKENSILTSQLLETEDRVLKLSDILQDEEAKALDLHARFDRVNNEWRKRIEDIEEDYESRLRQFKSNMETSNPQNDKRLTNLIKSLKDEIEELQKRDLSRRQSSVCSTENGRLMDQSCSVSGSPRPSYNDNLLARQFKILEKSNAVIITKLHNLENQIKDKEVQGISGNDLLAIQEQLRSNTLQEANVQVLQQTEDNINAETSGQQLHFHNHVHFHDHKDKKKGLSSYKATKAVANGVLEQTAPCIRKSVTKTNCQGEPGRIKQFKRNRAFIEVAPDGVFTI